MAVEFACADCGRKYRVDEAYVGKRTQCKGCEAVLTVPAPNSRAARARPPLQTFGAPPPPRPAPRYQKPPEEPAYVLDVDAYADGPYAGAYDDEDLYGAPAAAKAPEDYDEEIPAPRGPRRVGAGKSKKRPRVAYAGFWRRFAACFIDILVLNVAGFAAGFVFGLVMGISGASPEVARAGIVLFVLGWIGFCLWYYCGLVSGPAQATLGKQAMGIRVFGIDGHPISFGRAFLRELARCLSAFLLIGYIISLFTEKRQTLHDILVGTVVVKD